MRQHLKTGYYEKVYLPLKELTDNVIEAEFSNYHTLGARETPEPYASTLHAEEVIALVKRLFGEICVIGNKLKHDVPLQGYCDACPDRLITIKDAVKENIHT